MTGTVDISTCEFALAFDFRVVLIRLASGDCGLNSGPLRQGYYLKLPTLARTWQVTDAIARQVDVGLMAREWALLKLLIRYRRC